tara:strand:+ start:9495 stop:10115 length:621 start_codon:yes stop_codon:yes gene_type:complete
MIGINKKVLCMAFIFDLDYTLYGPEFRKYEHSENLFYSKFKRDGLLNEQLKQLPGKVYLFTNGNDDHALDVIKKMKLKCIFRNHIVTRDTFGGLQKPDKRIYPLVIQKFNLKNLKPQHIYFFEDTPKNLRVAKRLGWTTILIHPSTRRKPSYCDLKFDTIYDALAHFCKKKRRQRKKSSSKRKRKLSSSKNKKKRGPKPNFRPRKK